MAALVSITLSSGSLVQEQQPVMQEDVVKAPRAALPTQLLATTEAPAEVKSGVSVILALQTAFSTQLHAEHFQWLNALVALAFGAVLVFDGEFSFKWLLVGGTFCVAALFAHNEAAAMWSLGSEKFLRGFVGLEFGAFCAYVTYHGMEGVILLISVALGTLIAFYTQTKMVKMGCDSFQDNAWLVLVWYTIIILSCLATGATGKHSRVLRVISPLFGGALVSSAVSFFVTKAAMLGWINFAPSYIQPVGDAWVDFLSLLWNQNAQDVGIFTSLPPVSKTWPVDRVAGCLFWSILFLAGFFLHVRREKKVVANVVLKNRTAEAREPLLSERFICT